MTREDMIDEAVGYVFCVVGRSSPRHGEFARWLDIDLGIVPPVPLSVSFLAPAIRFEFTRIAAREAKT